MRESSHRQKSRILVLANDFHTAKVLVPALATRKTVSRIRGKGRMTEAKGVALLDTSDGNTSGVDGFKSGKYQVLVSTDSDVSNLWDSRHLISTVVNYDFPAHLGLYTNRAGYMGYCGDAARKCEVISIFTPSKANLLQAPHLVQFLKENGEEVPDDLQDIANLVVSAVDE